MHTQNGMLNISLEKLRKPEYNYPVCAEFLESTMHTTYHTKMLAEHHTQPHCRRLHLAVTWQAKRALVAFLQLHGESCSQVDMM